MPPNWLPETGQSAIDFSAGGGKRVSYSRVPPGKSTAARCRKLAINISIQRGAAHGDALTAPPYSASGQSQLACWHQPAINLSNVILPADRKQVWPAKAPSCDREPTHRALALCSGRLTSEQAATVRLFPPPPPIPSLAALWHSLSKLLVENARTIVSQLPAIILILITHHLHPRLVAI